MLLVPLPYGKLPLHRAPFTLTAHKWPLSVVVQYTACTHSHMRKPCWQNWAGRPPSTACPCPPQAASYHAVMGLGMHRTPLAAEETSPSLLPVCMASSPQYAKISSPTIHPAWISCWFLRYPLPTSDSPHSALYISEPLGSRQPKSFNLALRNSSHQDSLFYSNHFSEHSPHFSSLAETWLTITGTALSLAPQTRKLGKGDKCSQTPHCNFQTLIHPCSGNEVRWELQILMFRQCC